jgi:hypothetical protein
VRLIVSVSLLVVHYFAGGRKELTDDPLHLKDSLHLLLIQLHRVHVGLICLDYLVIEGSVLLLFDKISDDLVLFKDEAFELSLDCPKLDDLLVLNLLILSQKGLEDVVEVSEVRELHAQVK